MKKRTTQRYEKETGRKPIIGTLAVESKIREQAWQRTGCNAFEAQKPKSTPLAFWTEQDILQYIRKFNIPYASIYGDIVPTEETIRLPILNEEVDVLKTTGCDRTGCMFCMFGCHLEKEPNRFQRMKETHPKQYEYMLKPINEGGLGMKEVLDYIGVKY
jgi:3'-phosphoadenosine 5'-phosphosulfate sulfotransferase (PAPS reductase)/FAD synthetase